MGVIELSGGSFFRVMAVLIVAAFGTGCASMSGGADWPDTEADLQAPPADHEGEPRLIRGDDGMLYAVGALEEVPETGQIIFGRHGGQWPLSDMPRPALFVGQVVAVSSDDVARIHPLYQFPDIDYQGLHVEIAADDDNLEMGKGLGVVEGVEHADKIRVGLSLDGEAGVQKGDIYGVFAPYDPNGAESGAQLTRRLRGICTVVVVDSDTSVCEVRSAHPAHQQSPDLSKGQAAVFLEPRMESAVRNARVKVSSVDGHDIDTQIHDHLAEYFSHYPAGQVDVESFDKSVDASDVDFHRWNRRIDTNDPAALVGVSVENRGGEERVVLNYTGLGTAIGPGMVAAPPDGGVDMGPVDSLDGDALDGFAAMLMGAMLVYRGQTSEALMHLHEALRDPALQGKWRWHARDQYAMRWAALDRYEEAMWLVHEDQAVAREREDDQAYYNALGTRVRLHGYLDQHEQAYEASREYLAARDGDRPKSTYLSARAMYGEMALENGDLDAGKESVEELVELCPDGCEGDMLPLLAGIYWAAITESSDLQDEIVAIMVDLGQAQEKTSLATARMFQGWNFMRDDDHMQSLIAFLEARRLFERDESTYGMARADFYIAINQIARDEPQQAFDTAMEVLEYMSDVGDYASMVRIYERLSQIYVDIDVSRGPQPYLGAAPRILQGALQAHLSTGDYGRASEAGFGYGHFLFRVGSVDEARYTLQRAVLHGLRVARFDMVTLCHIFLAVIARSEGNMELFEEELDRARTMGDVADDPHIDELIEELLSPSEEIEDPTQLL